MAPSWNPRAVLGVDPRDPRFTCVGTTRQGIRCKQNFIKRIYLNKADLILQTLPELEEFQTDPRNLLPKLRELAWLTLCPRWHQTAIPQADEVANRWLGMILDLEPRASPQVTAPYGRAPPSRLPPTIPAPPSVFENTHERASARSSAASRAREHWGSQTTRRSSPSSIPAAAPREVHRNHRSIPLQETAVRSTRRASPPSQASASLARPFDHTSSATQNSPYTIRINLNITVSNQQERRHSSSHQESSDSSSSRRGRSTLSQSSDIHTNPMSPRGRASPAPSDTPSSSSSVISLSGPSTVMVNLTSEFELPSSRLAARPNTPSSTPASSRTGDDTRSPTLSASSNVSYMPPLDSTPFFSPPRSPIPVHPAGPLSISSESEPQSPPLLPRQAINTPSSSRNSSRIPLSPPLSPVYPLVARSPLPPHPAAMPTQVRRVRRRPLDDNCYVCYEPINTYEEAVWCRGSCGNNLHTECFEEWSRNQGQYLSAIECAFCRAPWAF